MDAYIITLRILHILGGVFWVGSALLFFFFIEPTVRATGPSGGQVMGHLVGRRKMPIVITISATITILAGVLLYWERSNGFDPDWIGTGPGIAFTVGGVAAILAWAAGLIVVAPSVKRMGALGGTVQAAGGPPSEEQAAELHRLDARLKRVGVADTVLLILAVLTMAVARYL